LSSTRRLAVLRLGDASPGHGTKVPWHSGGRRS